MADRFSRKRPIYVCLVGNTAFILLEMFATSLGMLFAGTFLNGVFYGFYFDIAPTYAAEVIPYHLRAISIAFTNTSLVIGQLLAQGVTSSTQGRDDDLAYRIPSPSNGFGMSCSLLVCGSARNHPGTWCAKTALQKLKRLS